MLLSIVIPVYNTLQYLPDCLRSVEAQNLKDYEIILVDDGSTDGSSAFCDDYRGSHDHVTVIHQENSGASAARNAGLLAARGTFIHFIDSDDFLADDHVYDRFISDMAPLSPDIVFSRCRSYSYDLTEIVQEQPPYLKEGLFDGDILYEVLINKYPMTMTSPVNKIFLRDFLLRNDLFFCKGIQHEEDEWLPRVISCAKTVYFYNEFLYAARHMRPGSLSHTETEDRRADKASSRIYIAVSGMKYMEQKSLAPDTLALVAEYYWDYFTDACVMCDKFRSPENKERIYREIKDNREFIDSRRWLKSKNRRMMGLLFKLLGVKLTVRIIGIRYGK